MSDVEDTHERSASVLTSANVLTNLIDHLKDRHRARGRVSHATDVVALRTKLGHVEADSTTRTRDTIHILHRLTDGVYVVLRDDDVAVKKVVTTTVAARSKDDTSTRDQIPRTDSIVESFLYALLILV